MALVAVGTAAGRQIRARLLGLITLPLFLQVTCCTWALQLLI